MWFERNPEGIPIAKIMDSLLLKNWRNHVSKRINTEFFYKTRFFMKSNYRNFKKESNYNLPKSQSKLNI